MQVMTKSTLSLITSPVATLVTFKDQDSPSQLVSSTRWLNFAYRYTLYFFATDCQ